MAYHQKTFRLNTSAEIPAVVRINAIALKLTANLAIRALAHGKQLQAMLVAQSKRLSKPATATS